MSDQLDDLAGCFRDGYDSDDIQRVFARVHEQTGVWLLCVWEYFDDIGYGGDSEFFLISGSGSVHELDGQLWPWLWGGSDEAPGGPGSPESWVGAPAPGTIAELSGDGLGNAAVENRT